MGDRPGVTMKKVLHFILFWPLLLRLMWRWEYMAARHYVLRDSPTWFVRAVHQQLKTDGPNTADGMQLMFICEDELSWRVYRDEHLKLCE